MQNPVPDERYSVADEAILGAFFKLLKKKTPDQITVSDITKTAGIARSTFYNHYQDIPSLVSAVEEKTIQDVFSIMEKFDPENDRDICQSYFLTICRYTMENPFLSSLLSTPHGNDLFEKMLTMLHHYVTATTSSASSSQMDPGSFRSCTRSHCRDSDSGFPDWNAASFILTCLKKHSRKMGRADCGNALSNRHKKNPSKQFTQTGFSYACGSSIRTSCLLIFFVVLRINGFFRITRPVIRR